MKRLKLSWTVFLFVSFAPVSPAQSPKPAQPADRLALPCSKILATPSADYIAGVVAVDGSNSDGRLRAIAKYGSCYDARTDALAASLARRGKGPAKAARADFASFEEALKDFSLKALADVAASPQSQKAAYANLYEKLFRRQFYEEYERKAEPAIKRGTAAPNAQHAASGPPPAPPANTRSAPAGPVASSADERARSDADPMTQAKNRFGKVLDALPEDQMHELHKAFSEVVGPHSISEATRLAVYRYAIFLLEPPSAKPFAPPPF